jgi:hypothetical protein
MSTASRSHTLHRDTERALVGPLLALGGLVLLGLGFGAVAVGLRLLFDVIAKASV